MYAKQVANAMYKPSFYKNEFDKALEEKQFFLRTMCCWSTWWKG